MSALLLQKTGSGGCRATADMMFPGRCSGSAAPVLAVFPLLGDERRVRAAPQGHNLPVCSLVDAQG